VNEEEQQREQKPASREQERRDSPKVWIASLSDYNAGHLHGAWVEADQEPDDIWAGVNEVLRTSRIPGAEEWAVFDYEGFGALKLSEYESVERISRLGRGIAEHGEAFAAFAALLGDSEDELLQRFEDSYLGHWESLTAYAEDYMQNCGLDDLLDEHVPQSLRPYVTVDAEALARDMAFEGALLSVEDPEGGGVFLYQPPI
jgi:antirestriction protein